MRLTYRGSPGSRMDQPEDAELTGYCPDCRKESDFTVADPYPGETVLATCWGTDPPHELEIDIPGTAYPPDPEPYWSDL